MTPAKATRVERLTRAMVIGSLAIALVQLLVLVPGLSEAVVVDGKRNGPSALKNQSHEDQLIDGYNTKTCGISDPDKKGKGFVNQAREGQFPWLVSFQIKIGNRPNHFCMGSFISDRWVLSAAHCWADP